MKKLDKKKIYLILLLAGFATYAICYITKVMLDTEGALRLFLLIFQYIGLLCFILGGHYFDTTYQYKKYSKESRKTIIDFSDERFNIIRMRAKAKTFDIMTYVLIIVPVIIFEMNTKNRLLPFFLCLAALAFGGLCYAFFYNKYSKEL